MIGFRGNSVNNKLILKDFLLILASGSKYRQELLGRLGLAFRPWSPEVDERAAAAEAPAATARRLALAKAQAGVAHFPSAWIIGSDQVAELDGEAIGKPGTLDNARAQLRAMRGRTVRFHTAVCLLHAPSGRASEALATTEVDFERSPTPRSSATSRASRPSIARAAPRAKAWASRCSAASRATTPPRSSDSR